MSDPFDEAFAKAEAEAAEQHRLAEQRRVEGEAREAARQQALRERFDTLKALILAKESVLTSRGFSVRESVDAKKSYYGLLLSGGSRRISVSLGRPDNFSIAVYNEGVREPDGFQTIINQQSPKSQDELMSILGDWIVRYGSRT